MPRNRRLGAEAEDLAASYLADRGYTIVTRNYDGRFSEIDIIAMDGEELVCVEVRSRSSNSWEGPEESVNPQKQKRLWQAADYYLSEVAGKALPVRFDVIAIHDNEIRHHKDAFRPSY